jgi:hypothetical protein
MEIEDAVFIRAGEAFDVIAEANRLILAEHNDLNAR